MIILCSVLESVPGLVFVRLVPAMGGGEEEKGQKQERGGEERSGRHRGEQLGT